MRERQRESWRGREREGKEGGKREGEGGRFSFKTASLSERRSMVLIQQCLQITYFVPGIVFGAQNTVFHKTFKVHALKEHVV